MSVINVARDFSRYPAGRFVTDGSNSGERFRDEFLLPHLQQDSEVVVELDGPRGYGSSFLEEAFGGLIRVWGLSEDQITKKMTLISKNQARILEILRYISEAQIRKI